MNPVHLDPYDHAFHRDPYPYYKVLRDREPVYYNAERGFWLLTRWADVHAAFRDFKTFCNAGAVALEAEAESALPYPMFIGMDPPDHTRVRHLFGALMTPDRLRVLEGYIREKTRRLVTPHLASGHFDFVADLGCYLPMNVISALIHIPESDQDRVRGWADDLILRDDKQDDLSQRNIDGYMNMADYFRRHIASHRANYMEDDLLGAMLQAERLGKMTEDELIGSLILLAIAGNETTTKLIGNLAYRLWQHPEQRQWLIDDPALIAKAVEEILRFDGSSQIIVRRVGRDVELHGKWLKQGDRVGLCIISANRDERKFANPDVFDIRRGSRDHMAFGFGIHACMGAALARLETRVVFEELLTLIPHYHIDESGLRMAHNPNVRGFTHVPASFEPA